MVVPTKVFIGNLPEEGYSKKEMKDALKGDLEKYGELAEFDVLSNYAFAHFKNHDEAKEAVSGLNGIFYFGKKLRVELSTSRVRQKPGMGSKQSECYRCGSEGHWSKDCPEASGGRRYSDQYQASGSNRRGASDRNPREDHYRGRQPSLDRYRPYPSLYDRLLPPIPRDLPEYPRDPYVRPPPEYYAARRMSKSLDPYDLYFAEVYGRASMVPGSAGRDLPSSSMLSSRPSVLSREQPY